VSETGSTARDANARRLLAGSAHAPPRQVVPLLAYVSVVGEARLPNGSRRATTEGNGIMADLYVVFDGEECIGLAATLDDASLVAQARAGEPLNAQWTPTTPHGWVLPDTTYRTILKPVTNRSRMSLMPTRATAKGQGRPHPAGLLGATGERLRRLQRSGLRVRVDTSFTRVRRRLARRAPVLPDR